MTVPKPFDIAFRRFVVQMVPANSIRFATEERDASEPFNATRTFDNGDLSLELKVYCGGTFVRVFLTVSP